MRLVLIGLVVGLLITVAASIKPEKVSEPLEEQIPKAQPAAERGRVLQVLERNELEDLELKFIKKLIDCRDTELDEPVHCCLFIVLNQDGPSYTEAMCVPREAKSGKSPPGYAKAP